MEDNPFNRLSPVNGKVFWKHGKQNAGQKNPGHYQKNFDHWENLKAIKKNEYYHMVRNDFDFNLIHLYF